jgi:hypothetical protein
MGIDYNYIAGHTDILLGNTIISEVNYDYFDDLMLKELIIQQVLQRNGYTGRFYKDQTTFGDFLLEWSDDKTSAKLYKNIVCSGYIFNYTKKVFIYSFFYTRVYNKECVPCIPFDEEISDVEDIQEVKVDFLSELKSKIQQREPVKIQIQEQEVRKTDFLIELEKEIDMRKQRAKKREKKLEAKRRKRKSKTT